MKFYLTSVAIWICILYASLVVCNEHIAKNGWIDKNRKGSFAQAMMLLFAICCIPVFRAFLCVYFFYQATHKKGE